MNTSKKLTIGFFTGMIAISVASLSFSIAWYATSSFLTVAPIEIEIQAERELKISTKNEKDSFKDALSLDGGDLAYTGTFAPVSSIFSKNWISSRAQTPKFYDCARTWNSPLEPIPEEIVRDDCYYYSEDFYMYADDDVYVTLDVDNTFIKPNDEFNLSRVAAVQKDHPELTKEQVIEQLNKLVKAMRFSILIPDEDIYHYYVIDPNKAENDEEVLFGGVLDNAKLLCYDTYTLNGEKYETVYGDVEKRELIHYDKLDNDIEYEGEPSAFNATHKSGTWMFNYEKSIENGVVIAKEESISLKQIKDNPEKYFKIPVDRGYENTRKMIISIYIEGWDRHSINSTMGAAFESNISFKILRENPK